MHASSISRRQFLTTATATTASIAFLPAHLHGQHRLEKLNLGIIGVANRGAANFSQVLGENIVAICDVDRNYLDQAAAAHPGARTFRDFREMLSKDLDLDAVVISTPDHTHAPASLMALREDKHVYCEKPLTHSVAEARAMSTLAEERGLTTQMGIQIHAGENYRRVVELIQSGIIGKVREAHVWCGKGWSNGRFNTGAPVPDHLDWDLWQGPAPTRPFSDNLHPANWRRFWDYGGGTLADMACHYMDLVTWALDTGHPTKIEAEGPPLHPNGTPSWIRVHWTYPGLDIWWHDGGKRPAILSSLTAADGSPLQWGDGQLFIGTEGMLISNYDRYLLLPEDRFANVTPPVANIPASIGHHREWLEACRGGSPAAALCNFSYAGRLTEMVLLGIAAFRSGETIRWDARSLRARGTSKAQSFIHSTARDGWMT